MTSGPSHRLNSKAEIAVTVFPGNVGGLTANVNRWRGQIGLAPLAPAELEANLDHLDANGLHFEIVVLV